MAIDKTKLQIQICLVLRSFFLPLRIFFELSQHIQWLRRWDWNPEKTNSESHLFHLLAMDNQNYIIPNHGGEILSINSRKHNMHTNSTCTIMRSHIQSLIHMDPWNFPLLFQPFSGFYGSQILGFCRFRKCYLSNFGN